MKKIIKIRGMGCKECSKRLSKALTEIPGVRSTAMCLKEKEAIVYCEDWVKNERLREEIKAMGFSSGRIREEIITAAKVFERGYV